MIMMVQANFTQMPTGCASLYESTQPTSMIAGQIFLFIGDRSKTPSVNGSKTILQAFGIWYNSEFGHEQTARFCNFTLRSLKQWWASHTTFETFLKIHLFWQLAKHNQKMNNLSYLGFHRIYSPLI